MADSADDLLVQRVAAGDETALASLYDRHGGLALGLAYRILGDRGAAEEAVQDAFLRIWRHAEAYQARPGIGARSWVLTIIRHRAIDLLRRRTGREGRDVTIEEGWAAVSDSDPLRDAITGSERARVAAAVAALPAEQRQAIELAYFEGLTHHEIAARTGAPLGTVKGRLRLGLRKLHASLAPTGSDASGAPSLRVDPARPGA